MPQEIIAGDGDMDASHKGAGGRQQQENPIVLVVDGDTERRFCTTVYLQRLQYHAFSVEKGEDAMQVMKLTRPLILITELVLPDMNGIDLLARMKQAPWTQLVPAIVYTAITDPAYQAPLRACRLRGIRHAQRRL